MAGGSVGPKDGVNSASIRVPSPNMRRGFSTVSVPMQEAGYFPGAPTVNPVV